MTTEQQIIECVPNFSEGRDMSIIRQITDAITSVDGVSLLNVDPGEATNRTVVTFVGEPQAVVEAAFRGAKKAGEVIDMRRHHGAHPRMGATDVLPLIPVAGITLDECAELARGLARRMADEAGIPCYAYEASALRPERKNLAVCRAGEYEAIADKLSDPDRRPDFMPADALDPTQPTGLSPRVLQTGCTAVGARDFLIAVNFNLNTTSTRRANAIAFDVREKGRPKREGNPITGRPVKDADGNTVMIPGTLKSTKAIGWYIDEYGIAQVSMNMTDLSVTPLHVAFDEVCRCASLRGIRVTGTEIVGLLPKRSLVEAGKYFLRKQNRSTGIPERDIIQIAVKSMGLDDLKPFNPREKVIEYLMEDRSAKARLADLTVRAFAEETSRESPAPGGGTVAACMGALGAALGTMVANLSAHKAGWDDRCTEFSDWADRGQDLLGRLLRLIDDDTEAFNAIMAAYQLPKKTSEEQAARTAAIQQATLRAAQVPLQTMRLSHDVFAVCRAMALEGNPASISDAGVGALAARAAVLGAGLNVKINAASLHDRTAAEALTAEADSLIAKADAAEKDIINIVDSKL